MSLIQFALKKSLLMNLLTVLVVVIGVMKAFQMQREAFPSVAFNFVTVSTYYPGASPKEVELYVTKPIEKEVDTVEGIEELTSVSIEGVSLILAKLDPDLDDQTRNKSVNQIQRAVDRVTDLPDDLPDSPIVKEPNSKDLPVLEVVVFGDLKYKGLHAAAEGLAEKIEELSDVSEVVRRGYRAKEYWVEVSPDKMREYNISFPLIIASLKQKNLNVPGGSIYSKDGEYLVRTIGEIKDGKDLENVVLRSNLSGVTVRLSDIANIKSTFEKKERIFKTNSNQSINLYVKKSDQGDIISMVDGVKKITEEYQKNYPDQNLRITHVNDMSKFVRTRLGVLTNNGVMGIFLVLFSLMLFLAPGIAAVTALGMPIAFMAAIAVMGLTGMTINLLTMFALVIVLGMLVDDAIIVAENIWQHYEAGETPWDAAVKGASEVFWPVTATIMTTIAAFSPLMMITGIFGRFIEEMPKVIVAALIMSLIEAMFVLPSHAMDVLRFREWRAHRKKKTVQAKDRKRSTPIMDGVVRRYGRFLELGLRYRWITLLVFAGPIFAGTLWFAKHNVNFILFPQDGIEAFYVRADLPVGVSLDETSRKFEGLEDIISKNIPKKELEGYVTTIGIQQDDPADPFTQRASNLGQVMVFLTPESQRTRMAREIIDSLRDEITAYTESHGFTRNSFSLQRLGPPVGKPIAIRVIGDDLNQIEKISDEIQKELETKEYVSDVSENFRPGKQELNVVIDEKAASRALLTVRDIAGHIRTSYEGQVASYIRSGDDRVAIRVRYPDSERSKLNSLNQIEIPNANGNRIKLSSVATIEQNPGFNAIFHRESRRSITVTAAIDETNTSSEKINEAMFPFLKKMEKQNRGVSITAGGEWEDTTESLDSLKDAFVVALGLVFLILATQFSSLTQPMVVMAAIPFGIIGVIWAFYFHGLPLSFLGLIGAIGLSGVVVNDSIVLVDFINGAITRGKSPIEACIYAGKRRFRAVWLTTATTVLGLIPMVYGIGGMDKFLRPAAVALGYGLIFGTILVLFFIPLLYLIRVDLIGIFFGKEFWKKSQKADASQSAIDNLY
ncbi:efflux RND transporter permease subunit [Oligoflexaceae bacterium]|nr:efflux RND transporter permease subunit [Oligoflexaceae bacterium]